MNIIYMDNAATSWPKPETVYQAVDQFNRKMGANPGRGSNHKTLEAGGVLLETREALAELFNISDSSCLVFTANVTESLNIGLKGWLNPGDHVIISGMEHNAVARPISSLQQSGVEVSVVPCDERGRLDPHDVELAFRDNTTMVCMLHASNITGTIMPIAEIGKIAHQNEAVFMVDAAQTAGVLPLNVKAQNIDLLAFTGHKGLMGPQGTGGLYIRPGLKIRPLIEGGTGSLSEHAYQPEFMPDRFESGTPNTPGIAGLGAGVRFIMETGIEQIRRHEQELTDRLISGLQEIRGISLYGPGDSRQQTAVISFNIEDMDCGELSFLLDRKYGIITRSGLHCAPLAHRTLGTLRQGACSFSPGFFNPREDIDTVIKAVHEIVDGRR